MLETWQMAALAATGLVGGMASGFLGIGGAVIMLPLLKIICDANPNTPLNAHTAIATTLVLGFCVGVSSTIGHVRSGKVMGGVIKVMIPFCLAASVAGVLVGNLFTGEASVWLWRLFGAMMVYVIGMNVYRLFRPLSGADAVGAQGRAGPPRGPAVALVGTLTGFAAGLLGIGGGAVAVPAQQVILRLGLRSAIANSAVAVIFSTLLAAVCKNVTLAPPAPGAPGPWTYVLLLAPPAVVGALVGSYLTHRVGRTWLRLVFIGFLAWTAYKMLTA